MIIPWLQRQKNPSPFIVVLSYIVWQSSTTTRLAPLVQYGKTCKDVYSQWLPLLCHLTWFLNLSGVLNDPRNIMVAWSIKSYYKPIPAMTSFPFFLSLDCHVSPIKTIYLDHYLVGKWGKSIFSFRTKVAILKRGFVYIILD